MWRRSRREGKEILTDTHQTPDTDDSAAAAAAPRFVRVHFAVATLLVNQFPLA